MSNDTVVVNGNGAFTLSVQGQGVTTPDSQELSTVRDVLNSAGVPLNTPVLINNEATTLDQAINAGDVVVASKPGQGA